MRYLSRRQRRVRGLKGAKCIVNNRAAALMATRSIGKSLVAINGTENHHHALTSPWHHRCHGRGRSCGACHARHLINYSSSSNALTFGASFAISIINRHARGILNAAGVTSVRLRLEAIDIYVIER